MAAHAFCIFVKDPARTKAGSGNAHLQWIRQLRTQQKLAAASPVENDPQMASIAIFRSESLEDANELVGEDEAANPASCRLSCTYGGRRIALYLGEM
jgi:uncharacterized protein YciI